MVSNCDNTILWEIVGIVVEEMEVVEVVGGCLSFKLNIYQKIIVMQIADG